MLGDLRVESEEISQLTRASHRRLLSILTLEAGRRIGTERLIDMFWGEAAPEGAKAALQTHVSALRRAVGAESIVTEGYGYRLSLEGVDLDVLEFVEAEELARTVAEVGDWEGAVAACSAGLGLWRGRPFTDLADDEFARSEIVRLEELHLELWEMWAGSLLRLGRVSEVLPELERLVVEHPYRERLWEHLMTARYRLGRHAEALRAFQEVSRILAEIGLEPGPELRRLEERILLHEEDRDRPSHNLPGELTSFVGRETELRDIAKLLADHRLVTLTGVGGSGKTRLALQAAADRLTEHTEGCWFVDLSGLDDPELIASEITTVLGLKPQGEDPLHALVTSMRHDRRLILLDNCEHLRVGAARVARALATAGEAVRVLATSRERLHVPGEAVYEVPPLSAPPEGAEQIEIRGYDAVKLFEDRAALVDPQFDLQDSAELVSRVCRRLDGIPLAIELVVPKVKTLGLELLDQLLHDRLLSIASSRIEAIPRHKTLEAAISWSYDLLEEGERRLFEWLSVFRGGFDMPMARHVAEDEAGSTDAVIEAIESLVAKSLVTRARAESGRFTLLETVREFARERLIERGQADLAKHRHLQWCVKFAAMVENRMYGTGRHELANRLRLESDNLQAGLDTGQEASDRMAISLVASAVAWHWLLAGNMTGARAALQLALDGVGEDRLREAELRIRLAHTFFLLNRSGLALTEAVSAKDLVSLLGPSVQKAAVLSRLANLRLLLVDQDPVGALALAREAVAVAHSTQEPVAKIRADMILGHVLGWNGEVDEGLEVALNARDQAIRLGDVSAIIVAYGFMFDIAYLHPTERRELPRRLVEEIVIRFPLDQWQEHLGQQLGWFPYVYIQTGEWDRSEEANQLLRKRRMEGYDHVWYLMTHGTLCWMRGDLEEASRAMAEIEEIGVNPRWYHDYYPLRADIAADLGDLEATRRHARAYLSVELDRSEEAKRLGVLNPLVRSEVNAALADKGPGQDTFVGEAKKAVGEMQRILDEFPPPSEGSLAMETHGTHLTFARAELSRSTGPDPELWREAMDRADYIYFRLYAGLRYGEALVRAGELEAGAEKIASTRAEASRTGAKGLVNLADEMLSHR